MVDNLLNNPLVQKGLNVKEGANWESCNMWTNLNLTFSGDWMLSYADNVKSILESGIDVLAY